MAYDYGNARIAAMRGRLLDRAVISRLGESATPSVMVAQLDRDPDWAPIMRRIAPLGADPSVALETAIEYHRSARLGALPPFYDGRDRRFVEVLVMPLDAERAVGLLRRRRAGEPAESIASTTIPGALLDAAAALFAVVTAGVVEVEIGQRFELSEAAEAHRSAEARLTTGSTLLVP